MGAGVTLTPETAEVYRQLCVAARARPDEDGRLWAREHGVMAADLARCMGSDGAGAVSPRLNVLMRKGLAANDPLTGRWAATPPEEETTMLRSRFDALPWRDEFESSNIARVAWEAAPDTPADGAPAKGTLYVEFQGGRVYSYAGVRLEAVEEMCEAESVGGYFNAEIKGSHEYARVQIEPDSI